MNKPGFSFAAGLITPARHVPSPNCDERPVGVVIDTIVVHCISLPPGQFGGGYVERFFCNRLDAREHEYFHKICELKVSSHFLIERDGGLVQFVPTHKRAWHAGASSHRGRDTVNNFSIGIELEGTDDSMFTETQYVVLGGLTRTLMQPYPGIAASNLVGHSDIAPRRKTDPGACFDWEKYKRLVTPGTR